MANKTGVAKGAGVDQQVVEQVKMEHRLGHAQTKIAKNHGISVATVRRYIQRADETPELEAHRLEHQKKFIDQAWETIHILNLKANLDAKAGEFKPKEGVVSMAVMVDKISQLETIPKEKGANVPPVIINIGSQPRLLPDAVELPYIEGEISSDDLRIGSGEDVLRLPGGRVDGDELPEDSGGSGSLDL